jgi:hypothetical protein
MKAISKTLTGAAIAALVSVSAAAPAQAQRYDPYYERDRGISAGDVIAGAAIVAGAVAVASAVAGQGRHDPYWDGRGAYDPRWGGGWDRGFERHAIQACSFEADRRYHRHGQTRFDVRDVQRLRDRVRVLGAVEIRDHRFDPRWGARGFAPRRVAVTCEVRTNGRIASFRTHNYNW